MFSSIILHFNYSLGFNRHALSQALVRMKAFQDRCVASKGGGGDPMVLQVPRY